MNLKRILIIIGSTTLLGLMGLFALTLFTTFKIDERAWNTFFNAAIPNWWSRATIVLSVILLFDWATQGHTISTILNIDSDSKSEDIRTAVYFLGFLALAMSICTHGSLF